MHFTDIPTICNLGEILTLMEICSSFLRQKIVNTIGERACGTVVSAVYGLNRFRFQTIIRTRPALVVILNVFTRVLRGLGLPMLLWSKGNDAMVLKRYASRIEEDRYWKQAERAQKVLNYSDSKNSGLSERKPGWIRCNARQERPIIYYTPRLLPLYREVDEDSKAVTFNDATASAEAIVRWHWLVFYDRVRIFRDNLGSSSNFNQRIHPTILDASALASRFDMQDSREISRMSNDLTRADFVDTINTHEKCQLCQRHRHKERWIRWLDRKALL